MPGGVLYIILWLVGTIKLCLLGDMQKKFVHWKRAYSLMLEFFCRKEFRNEILFIYPTWIAVNLISSGSGTTSFPLVSPLVPFVWTSAPLVSPLVCSTPFKVSESIATNSSLKKKKEFELFVSKSMYSKVFRQFKLCLIDTTVCYKLDCNMLAYLLS